MPRWMPESVGGIREVQLPPNPQTAEAQPLAPPQARPTGKRRPSEIPWRDKGEGGKRFPYIEDDWLRTEWPTLGVGRGDSGGRDPCM